MDANRLQRLLHDSHTPVLKCNQSWNTISEVLDGLRIDNDLSEERLILYLYQLKTKGERIWKAQAGDPKLTFEKFLSRDEIFDANRYKDGEVVLETVDLGTIRSVGFSATVLIVRRLDSRLHKQAFRRLIDYRTEHEITGPLLKKVVLRALDEIRRDPKNAEHIRTNTQSDLKRARLREANAKIKVLEAERAALVAEVTKLKAKVKELRAENKKLREGSVSKPRVNVPSRAVR